MKKVFLTKGLPGSGKSTWAKEQLELYPGEFKRISKDDLRAMLDNSRHTAANEKFILKIRDILILEALENGKHVIVDDTNLAVKHYNRIKQLVKGKAEVIVEDFTHTPLEECIKRDLKRLNSVGETVIKEMYDQFIKKPQINAEQDPNLPKIIICDLDGTLCILNGRNPFDASTAHEDHLNEVIYNLIKDKNVVFVSGRPDEYKEPTLKFLKKHGLDHHELHMRKTGDKRKDAVVKHEIYDNFIKNKYYVDFVLDDRNQVVQKWRELGLICLQVADGDF